MSLNKKIMYIALPLMLCFLVLYVLSFFLAIRYSFVKSAFDQTFAVWENYSAVINNTYFRLALKNTGLFLGIGVPCVVILAFILAVALNMLPEKSRWISMLFVMPLVLPSAAVIPFVYSLFVAEGSIVQSALEALGASTAVIKRLPVFGLFIWKNCGLDMMFFMAALAAVPREPIRAAKIDGAGKMRIVLRIILPQIMPTAYFVTVFSLVKGLNVFRVVYLLYGAYPHESVYLLQHYMNNHFAKLNYQNLSTGATIFAVIVSAVVIIMYRYERRTGVLS